MISLYLFWSSFVSIHIMRGNVWQLPASAVVLRISPNSLDVCRRSRGRVCLIDDEMTTSQIAMRFSGDLVRQSECGDLIYVGRTNDMVKRHGKRIRLQELEKVQICFRAEVYGMTLFFKFCRFMYHLCEPVLLSSNVRCHQIVSGGNPFKSLQYWHSIKV